LKTDSVCCDGERFSEAAVALYVPLHGFSVKWAVQTTGGESGFGQRVWYGEACGAQR
jgi:hypothetical protein